ncbi:MAG: outer membrane beta-barrel protein [Bacteroidales bacterium]|nr:outer membrane beta-barrel protein [Bacteroidales bacterium]
MKNSRIWQLIAALVLLLQPVYSQNGAYIETDSLYASGIKLIPGSSRDNAQFIVQEKKGMKIKYTPDQLNEYGFSGGPVYKSRTISVDGQPRRVFLERIRHGEITLYYYTEKGLRTFYLEKDSTVFVEIPGSRDFRTPVIENTDDFEWKGNQVQLVRYKRNSLAKLVSMYNKGINRPLPYYRFGINTGYSRMSLTVPDAMTIRQLDAISFTPASSVSFGIFTDLPIMMSDFSLNAGVNLSKHGFSANNTTSQSDIDVVINVTTANIPVLLRYTLPTMVWRPFLNAGGTYSCHLKYKREFYESTFNGDIVIINDVDSDSSPPGGALGYSFGIGLQYNLDYRKTSSLELRYNQFPGNVNKLNTSYLEVLASFSF